MSAKASVPFIFTSVMVMVSSSHKGWSLWGTATAPTWFRADAIPSPYLVQDCCNPYLIHVGVIISSNFMDPVLSGSGTPVLLRHALSSSCLFPLGHLTLGLPVSHFATCLALGVLCRAGSSSWGMLVLCSSCRSVVVSAAVVEVCVPCIDLSAGVLCGWRGWSWSCLVPRLPFHCWWYCESCIPLTSWLLFPWWVEWVASSPILCHLGHGPNWYCTFHSFSSSVRKLQWSARVCRCNQPAHVRCLTGQDMGLFKLVDSTANWNVVVHHWLQVIQECTSTLFLCFSICTSRLPTVVSPSTLITEEIQDIIKAHWVSPTLLPLSRIPCRVNQLSTDFTKSWKSSYWSLWWPVKTWCDEGCRGLRWQLFKCLKECCNGLPHSCYGIWVVMVTGTGSRSTGNGSRSLRVWHNQGGCHRPVTWCTGRMGHGATRNNVNSSKNGH